MDDNTMLCPGCGGAGERPPPGAVVRCPKCGAWMRAVRAPALWGEVVGEVELNTLRAQQAAGDRIGRALDKGLRDAAGISRHPRAGINGKLRF